MSKGTLRLVILVTGLISALVHLVLLNLSFLETGGTIDPLFTLNGLGTLGFLVLFYWDPEFVSERRTLLAYAFMAYVFTTIVAFFIAGGTGFGGTEVDPVGYLTKVDEVILIAALWMYTRRAEEPSGSAAPPGV